MHTQCTPTAFEFQTFGKRKIVAAFDGGPISSDGGSLLLREVDLRLNITKRVAACFTDYRHQSFVKHSVVELIRQRTYAVGTGHEDLNDHNELRHDPLFALAVEKNDPEGSTCKHEGNQGSSLASSSTLNRLELTPEKSDTNNRYHKIVHDPKRFESLFVDFFLEAFSEEPEEIILDFDATDSLIHGEQEGRFFHGYYGNYCYLPLYVFCGQHLLVAKLRTANISAGKGSEQILSFLVSRIRAHWPSTRIVVRADGGFTRNELMTWCEEHGVYFVLGLAKNPRLMKKIAQQMTEAHEQFKATQVASRVFTDFDWSTVDSWTRPRRVIAKAEHLSGGANPRFIVTNLPLSYMSPKSLYEKVYCARGDMENRIKEQQLDLFADRTSSRAMRANQLRLWFSSLAYVLVSAVRRLALKGTAMARSTAGSIRLKLFKIGAQIKLSVRRIVVHYSSACPYQEIFIQALENLKSYPMRC